MTYDKDSFLAGLSVGMSLRYSKRIPGSPNCLTFSSPSAFTLAVYNATKNWDGTLEYSTNAIIWSVWNGATTLQAASAGAVYKLYLRGSGNTVINSDNQRGFVINGNDVSCNGDIRTLLDYADPENTRMADYCFASLFSDCDAIISPPELPSMLISKYCYYAMFRRCVNLLFAPELPATTLHYNSYALMFLGCTSLTKPPRLSAKTLANDCYAQMLQYCTNLEFLPVLPALELSRACYLSMFSGCSKIKIATEWSAEYNKVYRIPASGSGTNGGNSLGSMFYNTGGTFTGTPDINTIYYTSNEIIT